MNKLTLNLESCYGIRALKFEFDFSNHRVYAIYAPNGMMKSSLAQTFEDVANAVPSQDRVFPARNCIRVITDESGAEIPGERVLVIRPYDEFLGHTEKTSTLLLDAKLKAEYEGLQAGIDKAKADLLEALKKQSKSRKDVEREISAAFSEPNAKMLPALLGIKEELAAQEAAPFADVEYDKIFDEKVLEFLATKDFRTAISDYVKKYNELLAASTYFKSGTFNYYNATSVSKSLADNGFFRANHKVVLSADVPREISSQGELDDLVKKEKEAISTDAELKRKYTEIEKLLTKNVTLRDFHAYISDHEELLPCLADVALFRKNLWKSYLMANDRLYEAVVEKHEAAQKRKMEIEQAAAAQGTQWEAVIEIFNDRFFVPFKLIARNKAAVVLGEEPILDLGFEFRDGEDVAEIDKRQLLGVLSSGESKALYILNVIFEIEARKKAGQETLFVIDDIADSFDYKNKYAIIQYLKDIADEPNFRQIILTHNFDFFRTINSRFVRYDHCLMTLKNGGRCVLEQASGIQNVFAKDWKRNFFVDPKKRIASIPFMRNLIEYTNGDDDPDFVRLTSLLHWRLGSSGIAESDLDGIYNSLFREQGSWVNGGDIVTDDILQAAEQCLTAGDGTNFENKIVLSIAIRISAERFMANKINDTVFLEGISANQTAVLFGKYRELFPDDTRTIKIVGNVLLMTPENIHLNSFMYEPILDMSDEHLRKLYRDVKSLS